MSHCLHLYTVQNANLIEENALEFLTYASK